MVCEHCGTVVRSGETVCSQCGAMLPVREMGKGAAAIRQGRDASSQKKSPVGSSVPDTRTRSAYVLDENAGTRRRAAGATADTQAVKGRKTHKIYRFMVNWAMIGAVSLVFLVCLVVGGYLFLQLTAQGQLVLARLGYEADTTAMWTLGGEYLDQGYIEKAIATEEAAYEKDPDREDIYIRLQQLCEAYEAGARPEDAERIYTLMYQEIDPANPVAYRNIVRLMLDQSRRTEAANLLNVAYANTGEVSFKTQRDEMLPSVPTATLEGGKHMLPQDCTLISAEGYDIYYIIGEEGTLPEDGQLFEEPIHLEEGGWTVRAVAVSSDLVSDELSVKYVISLPTPDAPYPSLAPGTYQQRQRMRLKNIGDDPNVTFYYTIDSTSPTVNSPIYNADEGILLPGGKVTVRAVAVNQYGKVSNEMSVQLVIKNVKYAKYYRSGDTFDAFALMKTTYDQFVKKYGTAKEEQEIVDPLVRSQCVRLLYSWGEARFYYTETGALLYYIDTTNANMTAPRSTKIGMTETSITQKYRDMGQAKNQDGSRSLYYDSGDQCYGKIEIVDDTHQTISYSYVDTENDATVTLQYHMENGQCVRLTNKFVIN